MAESARGVNISNARAPDPTLARFEFGARSVERGVNNFEASKEGGKKPEGSEEKEKDGTC